MKLILHPKASENYNSKIEFLLTKITSQHFLIEKMNETAPRNPNIHTSFNFDETNIIGDIKTSGMDSSGKITSRIFSNGENLVGLFDDDYKILIRLAEAFNKNINPKGAVSLKLLEELLFDWIILKTRNEIEVNATDFVLRECEKQIKEFEVWIPISLLYIQSPFVLGKITFKAITKSMIDDWENHSLSFVEKENEIVGLKSRFEKIRKDIQGLATATIKVEAEPLRAYEIAFEETEKTMSVLRMFSPANFLPTKVCYSAPWGKQHQDTDRYLLVKENKIVHHTVGFTDRSKPYWNITNEDLDRYIASGLDVLNFLLTKENLTDFQEKYFEAISIYSRSSLMKQLSDRLIYILVALETIFLKDSGEYIQDAISLRMAYMQPVSVDERRAVINNIKKVYKLRSSFIHHGQNIGIDDMEVIEEFVSNACLSLLALIQFARTDISLEKFFESLENRKLSG